MRCPNCAGEVGTGANYCPNCGTRLASAATSGTPRPGPDDDGRTVLGPSTPGDADCTILGTPPPVEADRTVLGTPPPVEADRTILGTPPPVEADRTILGTPPPVDADRTILGTPPPVDADRTVLGTPPPVDGDRTVLGTPPPSEDRTVLQPSTSGQAPPASRPPRVGAIRSTAVPRDSSTAPRDSATGPLSMGQQFSARYIIVRLLGIGGTGAVYQAWDGELSVMVALKVIRPEV